MKKDRVSKIDAAKRQLSTAIDLWFHKGNMVSIHTLTCAAHQIIHDVLKNIGLADILYKADFIKTPFRKEWIKELNKEKNFFKHADTDSMASIEFDPKITEPFIMATIVGVRQLNQFDDLFYNKCLAFILWFFFHNSEWFNKKWYEDTMLQLPLKEVTNIKSIEKHDFLWAIQYIREKIIASAEI